MPVPPSRATDGTGARLVQSGPSVARSSVHRRPARRVDLRPSTRSTSPSRFRPTACARKDILADFDGYVRQHETGNRVGEWALGTNLAVKDVIGEILQDEKIPGLGIAFGHPYAEQSGAKRAAPTHIDIVGRSFDVEFDGVPIVRTSRYLVDPATLH